MESVNGRSGRGGATDEQATEARANAAAERRAEQQRQSGSSTQSGSNSRTTSQTSQTNTPPARAADTPTVNREADHATPSYDPPVASALASIAGLDGFSAIQMLLSKMGSMLSEGQQNLADDIKNIVDKVDKVRTAENVLRNRLADGKIDAADVTAIEQAFIAAGLDTKNVVEMRGAVGANTLDYAPFSQDPAQKGFAEMVDNAKGVCTSMKDSLTAALSLLQARAQREMQNDQEVRTTISNLTKKSGETNMTIIRNIA